MSAESWLRQHISPASIIEFANSKEPAEVLQFLHSIPEEILSGTELGYVESVLLARMGRTHEAISVVANFLERNPSHKKGALLLRDLSSLSGAPDQTEPTPISPPVLDDEENDEALADRALRLLQLGDEEEALKLILAARRKGIRVQDMDHIRALCFLKRNEPQFARAALLEELRCFPENEAAQKLYSSLPDAVPAAAAEGSSQELHELALQLLPFSGLQFSEFRTVYERTVQICENDIAGDLVECGVAAGGTAVLLAIIASRHSRRARRVYACDSFSGLPDPGDFDLRGGVPAETIGWGRGTYSAAKDHLLELGSQYGIEELLIPIAGEFEKTLPGLAQIVDTVSLLHIDCMWYRGVQASLGSLLSKVSSGGQVIVQDYSSWEGVPLALNEALRKSELKVDLHPSGLSVWFQIP